MLSSSALTPTEINRFIEAIGESDSIDGKGPMLWDGLAASASLAKDIAAFANSRDGGILVLGKPEVEPGKFQLVGLSNEQANSFETTKVANWINSRFGPPLRLVCHRHEYQGLTFIVITVSEFEDVPHICTKSFQDPDNPKKHLLREGSLYVRGSNAESAPISGVEQLRTLIGLATAKRGQEMLAHFEAMLKGRSLISTPNDEELFQRERETICEGLAPSFQQAISEGAWSLYVHPEKYDAERWPDTHGLEEIIRRRAIRLRDEFPPHYRGTHMREWGICNDLYGDLWTLARSGQLLYVRPYWENRQTYKCGWRNVDGSPSEPDIEPGGWINFKPSIVTIVEMLMFVARFVEEYPTGENIRIVLQATDLSNRKLVTTDFNISLSDPEPCRARLFEVNKHMQVEEFRSEWEQIAAQTMKRFVEMFPGRQVQIETMLGWIQKFKARQF